MGKDSKKRHREDDSSSSSSDSGDERKKSKKDKKDRKKEKKHKKDHKKEKKHDKGRGLAGRANEISSDDYFTKNPEFRLWLAGRGKAFGDLSDDDTKKQFKKFVEKWNAGELDDKLYKGISFSDLDSSARTSHKWGFAKNLDSFSSDTLKDQVLADTKSANLLAKPGAALKPAGSTLGMTAFESDEARDQRRSTDKVERKKTDKQRKEDLEELAPKPDPGSFQARMEKRAQKGHYCRDKRGDSPEMRQSDLMGDGGDGIKERLMRQQAFKEQKDGKKRAEQAEKLAAYNQKEKEKMNEFRRMMGLPEEA